MIETGIGKKTYDAVCSFMERWCKNTPGARITELTDVRCFVYDVKPYDVRRMGEHRLTMVVEPRVIVEGDDYDYNVFAKWEFSEHDSDRDEGLVGDYNVDNNDHVVLIRTLIGNTTDMENFISMKDDLLNIARKINLKVK